MVKSLDLNLNSPFLISFAGSYLSVFIRVHLWFQIGRTGGTKPSVQAAGGGHAFGDGVHDLLPAVCTIASREVFRVAGLMAIVDHHGAIFAQLDALHHAQKVGNWPLANRADNHVHLDTELAAGDRHRRAPAARVRRTQFCAHALQPGDRRFAAQHANRLRLPEENDTVVFRQLIFVLERRHFLFAAPINQINHLRAQAPRRGDDVDRGVACADAGDAPADFNVLESLHLGLLDELHRAVNTVEVFAGQSQRPGLAETHTDEDGVELLFDFGKGDAAADFGLLTNFDAQLAHQLNFAQGIGGTGLVRGNPVSVEPAGNFVAVEDDDRIAPLRELRCAGQRRRPRTDAGNPLAVGRARLKQADVVVEHVVHRVPLQPPDLDGLLAFLVHYAGALAQHLSRADTAAALTQDIGLEDHARRSAQVASENLLDKGGNINAGGASVGARGIEAVKTSGRLNNSLAPCHSRRNVREVSLVLLRRKLRSGLTKRHFRLLEIRKPAARLGCPPGLSPLRRHSSTAGQRR